MVNKKGLYSIHVRISSGNETGYIILSKAPKIALKHWNKNPSYLNYVIDSHPFAHEINNEIKEVMDSVYKVVKQNYDTDLSVKEIIMKVKGNKHNLSFNQYIASYIRKPRQVLEYAIIEKYKIFLKHFNEFNPNVSFKQLNSKLVADFQTYLQVTKKLGGASCKSYFDKFKVVVNQAEREMLLTMEQTRFLFADVKIKVEKPHRTFLEIDEIQRITI